MVYITVGLLLIFAGVSAWDFIPTELAGKPLTDYPYFQITRTINEDDGVYVAVEHTQASNRRDLCDDEMHQPEIAGEAEALQESEGRRSVTCNNSFIYAPHIFLL